MGRFQQLLAAFHAAWPGDNRQLLAAKGHIADGKGGILPAKGPAGQFEFLGNGDCFLYSRKLTQMERVNRLTLALQPDDRFAGIVGNMCLPAAGLDLGHNVVYLKGRGFGVHDNDH